MKHHNLTLGQIEATINKLGGEEGVLRFLRNERVAKEGEKLSIVIDGVEHEVELLQFEFGRDRMDFGEVLAELEGRCLRAGTAEELRIFEEKYPGMYKEFSIVAIGSPAHRRVHVLVNGLGGRRCITGRWWIDGIQHHNNDRILAVRK